MLEKLDKRGGSAGLGGLGAQDGQVHVRTDKGAEVWRPWSERDRGIQAGERKQVGGAKDAGLPPVSALFPKAIAPANVDTVNEAAGVLAKMLASPELERAAIAASAKLEGGDRARFDRALGAFAMLADSALTMLDYDRMTTGWDGWGDYGFKYPGSRTDYRQRKYRYDLERDSRPRQERSRDATLDAVGAAIEARDPAAAMEKALVDRFFTEIGISEETRRDWKPDVAAIAKALDGEALIPLRALYAAAAHLDHRGVPRGNHTEKELNEASRRVVENIIRHVAEGDFDEWRFGTDPSKRQLACLSDEQLATFRAPTSVERKTKSGRQLKTRDEQGAALMWVTKIGGPSHGFDMLSQCLIPLLANARNNAIVIDDDRHQGAARSIFRVLPDGDGKPMLFLEMLQVDYPYERSAPDVARDELRAAIFQHAVEKAKAMGIPLVIAPSRHEVAESILKKLGEKGERRPVTFTLEPSGGVFESSDTLLGSHHRAQTEREVVKVPDKVPAFSASNPFPCVVG